MKTSTILAALGGVLSFGIQSVTATCYGSGDTWPNTEEARSFVHDACYNQNGMFTGGYAPSQTKSMCPRSGPRSLGLVFEVQNLNSQTGFDLGDDDCYTRLTNEIFGCSMGGESRIAGWRFR